MDDFTNYGTCRCCHDPDLLNDDGRCSSCVDAGVTEEWQVDDESDGTEEELVPA